MEVVSQRVCQEVIEHVIVLSIPCWCIHVGDGVSSCVVNGDLSIVCENVLCGFIIDWHSDEMMPMKMPTLVMNTREEHDQIVGFSIEFRLERGDSLVVQFGGCRSCIRIVEVQDGM